MKNSRFMLCPCCNGASMLTYYNNDNLITINNWKEFFYGSSKFIKNIFLCENCGYKFIDDITPNYVDYYEQQDTTENESMNIYRKQYFKNIKKKLLALFPNINIKNLDILDIGCSNGLWLDEWQNKANLYGSEYSTEHIQLLQNKNISVIDFETIKKRKFNIISLFDVLEHVENPKLFLKNLYPSLFPGGILIIGVPNMGKIIARAFGHHYYLICPMHFSYFNKKSMSLIMKQFFNESNIFIEHSPRMNTNLQGIARWIKFLPNIPHSLNFTIPIPYRASLLCFARKEVEFNK